MCEAVLMVWSCILDWSDRLCFDFSTFKWLLIVPSPSVSPIYPSFFVTPDGPLCGEESENVEFSLEMCAMEEGSEPTEVYCGSKAECTVGNLLPGTTYRFQVRASNSAGVSHPACMIQRFMHDLALYQWSGSLIYETQNKLLKIKLIKRFKYNFKLIFITFETAQKALNLSRFLSLLFPVWTVLWICGNKHCRRPPRTM